MIFMDTEIESAPQMETDRFTVTESVCAGGNIVATAAPHLEDDECYGI